MDGNIMQNVLVMYSYVMNNLNKIKTIIISDPEFGKIKYSELSYLDRQGAVKKDLNNIIPELRKNLNL